MQLPLLAGRVVVRTLAGQVDGQLVAGADLVEQPLLRFERDQVAAVDRVAVEDAGVELGDDGLDAGGGQGDRGVLARRAAAEVLAGDDDLVGETNSSSVWNGTCPLGSPACDGGTLDRAYLPNILYSAGIDGLYVRYWAGMIWSVSMLSPRTYALPVMTCCMDGLDRCAGAMQLFLRRGRRGVEDERRPAVTARSRLIAVQHAAAAQQPPLNPALAGKVHEHRPDQDGQDALARDPGQRQDDAEHDQEHAERDS